MQNERLTERSLSAFALANGSQAFGYISRCEFLKYLEEIDARPEYDFKYRSREQFKAAATPPAFVKTMLVLVVDYFVERSLPDAGFRISNYSRACWPSVGAAAGRVTELLKKQGFRAEGLNVPARTVAIKAGLGFIGKNTIFYAHNIGSYVGIAVIGTDLELEPREGLPPERVVSDHCAHCGKCIRSCPTGAIQQDGYRISPLKCVSFLNRHPEDPQKLMPASAKALEGWLHGCETCQDCCPINQATKHHNAPKIEPEIDLYGMRLPNKACIEASVLEEKLGEIKDPDFLLYVRTLLGT